MLYRPVQANRYNDDERLVRGWCYGDSARSESFAICREGGTVAGLAAVSGHGRAGHWHFHRHVRARRDATGLASKRGCSKRRAGRENHG